MPCAIHTNTQLLIYKYTNTQIQVCTKKQIQIYKCNEEVYKLDKKLGPPLARSRAFTKHTLCIYSMQYSCNVHPLIIVREVLILTLPIFIALYGCISWCSLATEMISNCMIIFSNALPPGECAGKYCPGDSISQYTPQGEYHEQFTSIYFTVFQTDFVCDSLLCSYNVP